MIAPQFLVFAGVGLATTVIDVTTLAALLRLGAHYTVATTLAFAAALVFNYLAHASVTFRATRSLDSMLRYGLILTINYLLTLGLVGAANSWIDNPLVGKLASIPLVTLIGFFSGRYWVFR